MKIAYISKSIIPSQSANSVQVMKMCQAFAKNGHKVVLYARPSKEKVKDVFAYYGVDKCFDIKKGTYSHLRTHKGSPDIFYGRDDIDGLLKAASAGKPVILEVHDPPKSRTAKERIAKLISHRNFKHLVTTSEFLKKQYLQLFPKLNRKKIIVAHNGADLPTTLQSQDSNFTLLGRNTKIKIGYIGHLYPGKGMEIIVQLAERLPDIDFHIIGGMQKDIKHWKKSINMKNIIFYGFVPHGLIGVYYNLFDIVLAPYQNKIGTFGGSVDNSKWICPLKIFDYMAHSKVIIASNTVLHEVLSDGINSILCPPQDIDAWVKAVLKLVNNPKLREKLATNAYNEFITHYIWKKRAKKVLK